MPGYGKRPSEQANLLRINFHAGCFLRGDLELQQDDAEMKFKADPVNVGVVHGAGQDCIRNLKRLQPVAKAV
jgi:hypothetical protein